MRPEIPVIRQASLLKLSLPRYRDGVGTILDVFSANIDTIQLDPGEIHEISLGFTMALPLGLEAQIRSSDILLKEGVTVLGGIKTIDASHRDEIKIYLINQSEKSCLIRRGQVVAEMIFAPVVRIKWDEIEMTSSTNTSQNQPSPPSEQNTSDTSSDDGEKE